MSAEVGGEKGQTRCDRCGYGIPFVHGLTDAERALAEHFLSEVYVDHGSGRGQPSPVPVSEMLHEDPHYFLCQNAIRDARRLLLAFPDLALHPGQAHTP